MDEIILDEYMVTVFVRVKQGESYPPDKWDWTTLLDLDTGAGEQAWVENATLLLSGTEEDLDSG